VISVVAVEFDPLVGGSKEHAIEAAVVHAGAAAFDDDEV
jgi:hypothetical protein